VASAVAACPRSDAIVAAVPGGLPDVTLACLEPGSGPARVRLAGLRGRPLVLNMWATWCAYCRAEMPLLAAASRRAGGRVTFLGLDAEDDTASGRDFAAAAGVPYNSVVDGDGVTKGALRWSGLPVTVFYTPGGREAGRHVGPLRDAAELAGLVRRYLGVDLP